MHFLVALALLKLCQKCTEVSMVEQEGTTGSPPGIKLFKEIGSGGLRNERFDRIWLKACNAGGV